LKREPKIHFGLVLPYIFLTALSQKRDFSLLKATKLPSDHYRWFAIMQIFILINYSHNTEISSDVGETIWLGVIVSNVIS